MKNNLNNKVLYFHINPLKNEIFYVGIGNKKRAYSKRRSKFWHKTVNKYGLIVDVVEENLTMNEAKRLEVFYINKIGRRDLGTGTLVNLTDGGEGNSNYIMSQETKDKISKGNKGKILTEETKEKIKNSNIGFKHNDEFKEKISIAKTGTKLSQETKDKISKIHKGKIVTEETRLKLSLLHKGKNKSEESRKKQSETNKGKILSDEIKKKISEKIKLYWLKKKQDKLNNEILCNNEHE